MSDQAFTCCCTNQCRQCGACCAVGCPHRGSVIQPISAPPHPAPGEPPQPVTEIEIPSTYFNGLTERRVREIVREELRNAARRAARA